MITDRDVTHNEGQPGPYIAYKRRWWILISFSCLSLLNSSVWNTFGPIFETLKYAYDWSDGTVAMIVNWATIMFIMFMVPLCWLFEKKGLRFTTILVATLMAIGTCLRVITTDDTVFTIFAHICAILNGIAGVTLMSAPPALSAIWFPPGERTTATCINKVFNNLGNGVSFLWGPYFVPEDGMEYLNSKNASIPEVKENIQIYMGTKAGIAVGLLVAFLIYFPRQPPSPPSASASLEKMSVKEGIKALLTDKSVLLCTFSFSFSGGIFAAWEGIMAINFQSVHISDVQSGYIGLTVSTASAIIAIGISYINDNLKKKMKTTIIILLVLEALSFTWLTLILSKVIPFSIWQLWVSAVVGSSVTFTLSPIFFEYTAEMAYPVPEGLVGGFLTCVCMFIGGIFLFISMIPNIGTIWMNYVLVASALVSIPAVMFTKESYRRLDIDVPPIGSHEDVQAHHAYHSIQEN